MAISSAEATSTTQQLTTRAMVNYIVEHAAPSAVCLVRKIQNSPYQPLSSEKVLSVATPNVLSLRPPTHVAHQALMEFYSAINGHCGVNCPDPFSIELQVASGRPRDANAEGRMRECPLPHNSATGTTPPYGCAGGTASSSLPHAPPSQGIGVVAGGRNSAHQQNMATPLPSPAGSPLLPTSAASSSEDYRLSQIRRNERHVGNATYGRVCTFFLTREGCRRGKYCNFLHIGKGPAGGGSALP
ncbi:hypothetical protein, conserved [Trypanosoma brucei gambiense DAL972]|uniref:C3H1-type domain-containing protein n=2 Tax=Trypanosoma brucei TaxID=5691 RepID=C9ZVJ5_TRYB9|nr:hypothetical protein, conserved [Trypanosoma brucei gambiense DAL972]XP_011775716.1 hypothetical protein, conserved [Trypanosoma brucei gambiense DAL972]RHW70736.1 zinc finger protein family member [Trypanosoma brucei equiperdum]RHW71083.1 zinc finger protein family member [Trypanosoma brucei equiperdum]CBH13433.1 hypothetical protein, conserved [Trypanosoma brucei gambiense DAL972]CBH13439.1 hypothetical protein, conserved [Trypanosoma brucei gambiense DAL972]|eukprot:XP_011775710.1 hypothetical protein, conserved [Trypanosoma brucei gambiense DAL972]